MKKTIEERKRPYDLSDRLECAGRELPSGATAAYAMAAGLTALTFVALFGFLMM